MARPYETVLIFDSSLEESSIEEKIDRFKRILSAEEPAGVQSTNWGRRKLAYPIGKKEQGVYAILRYQADAAALAEFERVARLDEQILRHLTVVNPPAAAGASGGGETHAGPPRESRHDREEE